eukprot:scaffold6474_cov18-Tisochrysis_lutea.AAC.4
MGPGMCVSLVTLVVQVSGASQAKWAQVADWKNASKNCSFSFADYEPLPWHPGSLPGCACIS